MSNFFNNKIAFSSNKSDWETPQKLFNKLNQKYNFTWDLAASKQNAKCKNYFTKEQDSLIQDWSKLKGNLYLNPPYGRHIQKWVEKAYYSSVSKEDGQSIILLLPSRTDTSYWHEYIFGKAKIYFLRGRLKFELNGESSQPAPFPSAIIEFCSNKLDLVEGVQLA